MPTIGATRGKPRTVNGRVLLALTACLGLLFGGPVRAETYAIGLSLDLQGPLAEESRATVDAVRMLVEDVNAAGTLGEHTLEVIVLDDASNENRARENATRFAANPDVLAVVGHQYAAVGMAAADIYHDAELVNISPSASHPDFARLSPWVFSMNFQDGFQGTMVAAHVAKLERHRRVLVVHSDTAYGQGLAASFMDSAPGVGIEAMPVISFPEGQFAQSRQHDRLLREAADADTVVLLMYETDGLEVIEFLRGHGIATPLVGADAFSIPAFLNAVSGRFDGITVVTPFLYQLASLHALDVIDRLGRRLGMAAGDRPPIYVPFAYDAAQLVIEALHTRSPTRAAVRAHLTDIDRPVDAIEGIGGRVFFDRNGAAVRPAVFAQVAGGALRPAYRQLKPVFEQHVLDSMARGTTPDNMIFLGDTPYYRIQVVYAGLDLYRINNVNVREQRFDLEAFLWLRWEGDLDDERIGFVNEIFAEENQREELAREQLNGEHYVLNKIKSKFVANYNLREFPFDIQKIDVKVAHRSKTANELVIVQDRARLSPGSLTAIYPAEWRFLGQISYAGTYPVDSTFGRYEVNGYTAKPEFSVYGTEVRIARIIMPYIWTVFLPLTAMFCITFLAFLIPPAKFEARLSVVTSALLSVLVFHLTQASGLPPVGYLIRMDFYFIAAYVTILLVVVVVIFLDRVEWPNWLERMIGYVLFGLALSSNGVITWLAMIQR